MAKRPNVLLITSDQQHWSLLGIENPEVKTPHLDQMAANGTHFRRAYCPNPTCTPTRASLITGLYPSQHGAYSLGTKLDEKVPTVGEAFQKAGYDSTLVGKAHFQPLLGTEQYRSLESYPTLHDLDFWRDFHGPFYGFNHLETLRNHVDEHHAGQHYAVWLEDEKDFPSWRDHYQDKWQGGRSQELAWTLPQEYHYNEFIVEKTNERLEHCKDQDQPFFLWASFPDPHPPYLVPEPWASMYDPAEVTVPEVTPGEHDRNPPAFGMTQEEDPDFSYLKEEGGNACHGMHSHLHDRDHMAKQIATYYGMMSYTDDAIGRILAKIKELGMEEDTLVVFTSDHGHFYGQHGMIAKGAFHFEDLIRVPMIAKQPGRVPSGRVSESLQSLVDYAPSFLSACGIEVPMAMTGEDQTPVWFGDQEDLRDHVIVENRHQPSTLVLETYVGQRYKITVYTNADHGEIFDLEQDPGEINNLWDDPESAALKQELLLRFTQAQIRKEPVPMPRICGA